MTTSSPAVVVGDVMSSIQAIRSAGSIRRAETLIDARAGIRPSLTATISSPVKLELSAVDSEMATRWLRKLIGASEDSDGQTGRQSAGEGKSVADRWQHGGPR